jgi:hypothetical protein
MGVEEVGGRVEATVREGGGGWIRAKTEPWGLGFCLGVPNGGVRGSRGSLSSDLDGG